MKIKLTLILLALAAFLTACGSMKGDESKFEEDKVIEVTDTALEHYTKEEYEDLINMGDENLKKSINAESFSTANEKIVEKMGKFVKIDSYEYKVQRLKNIDYAVVIYKVEHENKTLNYIISLNENYELAGFLIN